MPTFEIDGLVISVKPSAPPSQICTNSVALRARLGSESRVYAASSSAWKSSSGNAATMSPCSMRWSTDAAKRLGPAGFDLLQQLLATHLGRFCTLTTPEASSAI